jgi:hypothetical protein
MNDLAREAVNCNAGLGGMGKYDGNAASLLCHLWNHTLFPVRAVLVSVDVDIQRSYNEVEG